jgi:2-amino-4-hydroxy-6-hydroxymethyldihydropteridine diphosphokinase
LGRKNKHQNAQRIIDIDLLFLEDVQINAKNLILPHPRLHLRNFTLKPLLEINSKLMHPIFKKAIEELAKDCADTGKVSIFDKIK